MSNDKLEKAAEESKQLSSKPDNNTLLKLYSLYKQAKEGDAPEEANYNMFDFVAKAKHTAWLELKGMSSDEATDQYAALVEHLKNSL